MWLKPETAFLAPLRDPAGPGVVRSADVSALRKDMSVDTAVAAQNAGAKHVK